MTPEGIKRVAVFCIIKSGHHYLLLKRAKFPNQGKFVPVGGKVDPYETPIAAVIRETMEETGIVITNPRFCGILTETSPVNYNWVSYIYMVEIPWLPAPACDEGELYWVHADELKDLDTPPTDWYIYQYVNDELFFVFNAVYDTDMKLINMTEEMSNSMIC